MNPTDFDQIARAFGRSASRRRAVGFVAGGALALLGTAPALAKGRRQRTGGQSPAGQGQKVTLCHQGHTIEVAEPAVSAHLAQGDTLGPCRCRDGACQAASRGVQMIGHVNAGQGVVRAAYLALVGNSWKPAGGQDLRPGNPPEFRFQTAQSSALLQMVGFVTHYSTIFNIRVDNAGQELPTLTMGYGCDTEPPFACDTIVFAQKMQVGDLSSRMQADEYSFRVSRLSDTAAYQVFDVVISPPN